MCRKLKMITRRCGRDRSEMSCARHMENRTLARRRVSALIPPVWCHWTIGNIDSSLPISRPKASWKRASDLANFPCFRSTPADRPTPARLPHVQYVDSNRGVAPWNCGRVCLQTVLDKVFLSEVDKDDKSKLESVCAHNAPFPKVAYVEAFNTLCSLACEGEDDREDHVTS